MPNDYEFSGSGDIDRSADSATVTGVSTETTNERSRMWNAVAAEAEVPTDFGRAFPQPGAGGVVGDEDLIRHAYGDS